MSILCVGQMVADILIYGVDKVDFSVDTKRVEKIAIKNGGDCLNTAIILKKLGNDVKFCGALGRDAMGEFLAGTLSKYGIGDKGIQYLDDCSTSTVAALINHKGERVFLYYGGTNDRFSYGSIDTDMVEKSEFVHVGGTFQLPAFDGEGAYQLFKTAHCKGGFTSMDVTWDTTGRWLETIRPCLPELDLFMPSLNEAREMVKSASPEEIAAGLKEEGVKNVIIKLGSKGCYVDAFGEQFYQSALPAKVVDTTGAGDSFVAGILTGLSQKWDIHKTVKFASAVSAECIGELGATTGIHSIEEIIKKIESEDKKDERNSIKETVKRCG